MINFSNENSEKKYLKPNFPSNWKTEDTFLLLQVRSDNDSHQNERCVFDPLYALYDDKQNQCFTDENLYLPWIQAFCCPSDNSHFPKIILNLALY